MSTKINKYTNKQAIPLLASKFPRFHVVYRTIEHIQNIRVLIEKSNEYNMPLHLAFIDYQRDFDSVKE